MRFCECLDKCCVAVGCSFAQPVMHVCDSQPFDAKRFAVSDEIMREANRIQTARNCKQQAFETMTTNTICDGIFQKKP